MALLAIVIFPMAGPAAGASIAILEPSPLKSPDHAVLPLDPRFRNAYNYAKGSTRKSKSGPTKGPYRLITDGDLTYEDFHISNAIVSLRVARVLRLDGTIGRGDFEALKTTIEKERFLDCLSPGFCPYNNVLALNSPGGSFSEAMKIAQYVDEQNIPTVILANQQCESACSLIFFSGHANYDGFFFPRRFAHETATIGLHRPYIALSDQSFTGGQVKQIIDVLNASMNRVISLFLKARVSQRLLDRMYDTPADSMYRLNVPEMALNDIFVLGRDRPSQHMDRPAALRFCANAYRNAFNDVPAALLENLQMDQNTFITFQTGRYFACLGSRNSKTGTWSYSLCLERGCRFEEFGAAGFWTNGVKHPLKIVEVGEAVANAELGIALETYRHRSALLEFIRAFGEDTDGLNLDPMQEALLRSPVPAELCGRIDTAHPVLIRLVQEKLNGIGIDVGRPDGSYGPNTRKGIKAANKRLLGAGSETVSVGLIAALGLPEDVAPRFTICDERYES